MNKLEYKSVLIVEDNTVLRNDLVRYFSVMNKVTACASLASAKHAVDATVFDIVLLDIVLPDGSGLKLLEKLSDTPVIILSDLGSDSNVLDGFSAGAVDYIVKPASPQVIETRMCLRLLPAHKAQFTAHGLELNTARRTAIFKSRPLDLTSSEFNILLFLLQHSNEYFTADEIYEHVWQAPHMHTATVKVHISNLRKKMFAVSEECAALITSEFGKGYAFTGN